MDRHGRQSRLADVGAPGQQRIAAATVEVRSEGLAGEVATRYLAGAGVGALRVLSPALAAVARSVDPAVRVEVVGAAAGGAGGREEAHEDPHFRDPVARDLARGAREALHALRKILGGAS
jgi:hypothetical protein